MNAITTLSAGTALVSASARMAAELARAAGTPSEFAAGVSGGFAVMSIKGKVFAIRHKGVTTPLLHGTPPQPVQGLDVVMVRANPTITKTFYVTGYKEGSNAPPDCSSANGVTPDTTAPHKQANTCAVCPHNAWGSAKNEQGVAGKGKACQDTRRVAIVPAAAAYTPGAEETMKNDPHDGPILLRVPPASLGELLAYDAKMRSMGHLTYGLVTRLGFDFTAAHPKLTFTPVRALTDPELEVMFALRDDARTENVLSSQQVDMGADAGEATAAVAPAGPTPEAIQAAALAQWQAKQAADAAAVGALTPAPVVAPAVVLPAAGAPVVAATAEDPAFKAFMAHQAAQKEAAEVEAKLAAEAAAKAAAEAAEAKAWAEKQAAEAAAKAAAPAAPAIPPAPPGVDPVAWAAFHASQQALAAPAVPQAAPAAPEPAKAPRTSSKPRTTAAAAPATTLQPAAPPSDVVDATPSVDALLAGLNIAG